MNEALGEPLVAGLPFTGPWLLAPMEGVTDPTFRDVVLALHRPADLGGAFTEFVRVVDRPKLEREFRKHLGERRWAMPVGVQLMGRHLDALAASACTAVQAGAPLVDLNFGCPAKGALAGCAGSALLKEPRAVEEVVRVCVDAVRGAVPVTAKIRAGFDHARGVEDLARAVEAGGAAMLTIHCRTKQELYQPEVDWTRIERAVNATSLPVCGNGSALVHGDLERMRRATGCRFVMVGRGALGDPWVFSGKQVTPARAARFLLAYVDAIIATGRLGEHAAASRSKQLFRYWTAGELVKSEDERRSWLRMQDPVEFIERLRTVATAANPSERSLHERPAAVRT